MYSLRHSTGLRNRCQSQGRNRSRRSRCRQRALRCQPCCLQRGQRQTPIAVATKEGFERRGTDVVPLLHRECHDLDIGRKIRLSFIALYHNRNVFVNNSIVRMGHKKRTANFLCQAEVLDYLLQQQESSRYYRERFIFLVL